MNGFNAWIEKRNFKKICIICIVAAVLCGLFCAGAVGYVYKDKINLALQYEKASRAVKKEKDTAKLRQSMDALAASSNDICDVLLLDDQNRVLYTAKQSDLALNDTFELQKTEGSRFLQSDQNRDALFRFVKKDEFMLSAVFADDFKDIYDEYDEDTFYMDHLQNKKLYLMSPLGKTDGNTKIYVISSPTPVPYGMVLLKLSASILMLLFMLYWILVALWVYQNAQKSKLFAPGWGIIVLFTNLAGVLVYVIYKHINNVCAFCGAVQPKENVYCSCCGKKIGLTCKGCGRALKLNEQYCPKCGEKK